MQQIVFITGAPGAGKSTVGRMVAQHFAKSMHIQVDNLREMMVNGIRLPKPGAAFDEEVYQQFAWARQTATFMAQLYAQKDFTVVIDDVCVPPPPGGFETQYQALFALPSVHRILLLPSAQTVVKRLEGRAGPFDAFLMTQIDGLYGYLEPMSKEGWLVLDNSDWSPEQTLETVLHLLGANPKNHNRA